MFTAMPPKSAAVLRLLMLIALLSAGAIGVAGAQSPNPMAQTAEFLQPEVLSVRPHDPDAWIQGWVYYNGLLYESTGGSAYSSSALGHSTLREIDPLTGEVLRQVDVPDTFYGEGLARVDDRLIQITWKEQTALVYDLATFEQVGTFSYEGEGWGLCADEDYLYMTDGTPFIHVRDRQTFALRFSLAVTLRAQAISQYVDEEGRPLGLLNELECVGDYIYSNIWQTEVILRITKRNGVIAAIIDASNLREYKQEGETYNPRYLNGIAYLPESDTFLITGKYWPRAFEVRFVPKEG